MTKPNALLDLDGPLLDVSLRHCQVHRHVVASLGGLPLDDHAYWEAKRHKVPDDALLKLSGIEDRLAAYRQRKLELIEAEEPLRSDRVQPGALDVLRWLRTHFRVTLVTLRRHPERLATQLETLRLAPLLDEVLTAQERPSEVEGWQIKLSLVRAAGLVCGPSDVFVGDTETDVRAGQALGARTVAVSNGIRAPALLEPLHPTHLLSGIAELTRALLDR